MPADEEKTTSPEITSFSQVGSVGVANNREHSPDSHGLHRLLNNRQIQLIATGGSIGAALLFIAYVFYTCVLVLVNNSIAEMSTYMPASGGFIRLAGYWVDALGSVAGWNFFFYEALLIPFEITALNLVISFWNSNVTSPGPTAGICAAVIDCYAIFNILAVKYYGEAEFWLSGGKLILISSSLPSPLLRWSAAILKAIVNAFAEFHTEGDLGRFEGLLAALWNAAFTIVGPEYISMVVAEATHPSVYIKSAFKTVYYRFCIFFILGALTGGIVVPYNNPTLVNIYFGTGEGGGTAAASPYVIAMENLSIHVLPHIVNALILTSIFSASNIYTYCATRSLYSLAIEGRAPRFLYYCNNSGVLIYCFCVVMLFPCLSFLQFSKGADLACQYCHRGGLITFLIMSITFLNYYQACKVQGIDRKEMPYYGYFQPFGAYITIATQLVILISYGYSSFTPWNISDFLANYTMQLVAPCFFIGWKVIKKTRYIRPNEVDLIWKRPAIDAYENSITTPPLGFWTEIIGLVGFSRAEKSQADAWGGRSPFL
ncbi:unnamed protein product [Clonostachys rhizophaga]|uniref:Amino acid permease/ SLC12A domain-containing protein n=1 Tax=Clonostachys rhizophaga TaxID=160324 RepID=A0A9N9VUB4_9HYPO|nr:unnamed protein product [Clonostachys rhizophaga]